MGRGWAAGRIVSAGPVTPPRDLLRRGTELWMATVNGREADAAWLVLLHEACRMADRLDDMAQLLAGDIQVWARIELPDLDGKPCVLIFDDALAETRQYVNTLRQLTTTLGIGKASMESKQEGGLVDQLAAARAARLAGPAEPQDRERPAVSD